MNIKQYIKESNAIEGIHSDSAIADSMDAWRYLKEQDEITPEIIKETHKKILQNRQPDIAGKYRDVQVYVGEHVPPEPDRVAELMDKLLEKEPEIHDDAIQWHIDFEKIHPFQDGNGRIGRMLYWWHCVQLGTDPVLWEARKRWEYYQLFKE